MCGILGLLDEERRSAGAPWPDSDLREAEQARDEMVHRGPDGSGLWHIPGLIFAHRRLAILDLSPGGHQPMLAPSGGALTFNGEIYNYLELKEELARAGSSFRSTGDTEVLLTALETWGLDTTLARLRGMFAFAWWDARTQVLHLARDPIGKKPLYYAVDGGRIAFASELRPLARWLRRLGVPLEVDPVAIEHHLAGGYIPAPRTVWKQVSKLAAGQDVRFQGGVLSVHKPRGLPAVPAPLSLTKTGLDHLDALLQTAVERRLRSDVPVATFLSGGLDSTLVTAVAARLQPGITAYTVRTAGRNLDELDVARRVARHTGVRHVELEVDTAQLDRLPELVRHYGEPFGDSSALPMLLIAELAGREHRVVLTGDGGDEVQGGYSSGRLFALRRLLHEDLRIPTLAAAARLGTAGAGRGGRLHALRFTAMRLLASAADAASAQHDDLHALHDLFDPGLRPLLATQGWKRLMRERFLALPASDELDRMLRLDFALYLPEDLCVKVDVASMARSVETRSPLLDMDFVLASAQIRAADRVRPWESKRVIRGLLHRHLPADCVLGRKQGFSIPLDHWMGGDEAVDRIADRYRNGLPGLPFLNGPAVGETLRRRRARGQDNGVLLWRLRFLADWAEDMRA
ncbi:MAG: asparagine synthase (glutamine-hydrolyzing) [Myxococcota bacterium]